MCWVLLFLLWCWMIWLQSNLLLSQVIFSHLWIEVIHHWSSFILSASRLCLYFSAWSWYHNWICLSLPPLYQIKRSFRWEADLTELKFNVSANLNINLKLRICVKQTDLYWDVHFIERCWSLLSVFFLLCFFCDVSEIEVISKMYIRALNLWVTHSNSDFKSDNC